MTQGVYLTIEYSTAIITLDYPDSKANVLSSPILKSFSELLAKASESKTIKCLIIKSNKPDIFIAGADIKEIQEISTEKEAIEKVKSGQKILNQLEKMSFPTIAAIHGACLGGGMELALACDFRIASDDSKTKLGLPEVNLGVIPGFGGTQRLPRLIGLQRSLPLILSGKTIDGKKAEKVGLVDRCVPYSFFEDEIEKLIAEITNHKKRKQLKKRRELAGLMALLLEKNMLGRSIIFKQAKKTVLKQTKGNYPAPLAALKAIKYGYKKTLKKGLDKEAKEFAKMVTTDISKNLIQIYFSNESLKKYKGTENPNIKAKKIDQTAVIGAGFMGGAISWLMSYRGKDVRQKDINWDALALGLESAYSLYQGLLKRKRIKAHEVSKGMHRISSGIGYEGFNKTSLVVEAIVEDMSIKKKVFKETENFVKPSCILATNTSALSVTEMSEELKHPERFVGMHFFSPVHKMPLVEIIPSRHTSEETVVTMIEFVKKLKKTPIVVQDCPGFLVNRILIPYVNEAVLCLQDGASIKQIDEVMTNFGMPLGPLSLADEVGLDVGFKVAKILEKGYGKRMAVAEAFKKIHDLPNTLGKKSQKGFYLYGNEKKTSKVENSEIKKIVSIFQNYPGRGISKRQIEDRLILIMVNEAARCLEEQVVQSAEFLDMAMIMGTGFPPFRGGLCRFADQKGISQIKMTLEELSTLFGKRFEPAPLIQRMSEANQKFYQK